MILCHICEKSFASKSNLYRHLRNVHGELAVQVRVPKCAQCSYTCSTQAEMRNHIETAHSQDERILCVYCSSVFHSLKAFNSHLKVNHSLPAISGSRGDGRIALKSQPSTALLNLFSFRLKRMILISFSS